MARTGWLLLLLSAACASGAAMNEQHDRPQRAGQSVKAFYFGHSLLAGSGASPSYHIPYDVGIFAAASGRAYEAHGQLGWGTPIAAHWAWNSDDLAAGPLGFARENHAPFYVGGNGKAELARGGYNLVVFTDVNGNARGAEQGPVVAAIVGFIRIARARDPHALAILYSCWNELPVAQQSERAAVEKWRDATLAELGWWESVADAVQAQTGSERMLLVPVSALLAELALAAANGGMPGLDARAFFTDDVHGTPLTYYAAAAALYSAIYREPPPAATSSRVHGSVSGAVVDVTLPSVQAAAYVQQRAFDLVRAYPRAGFPH